MAVETVSISSRPSVQDGVWIEVNLDSILNNLDRLRKKIRPFTHVMAVVKANAYGHGIVPVSKALQGRVDFLGIGSLKEASLLREQGVTTPLFLFGRVLPDQIPLALRMNLVLTVSSFEEARALSEESSRHSKRTPIHVKVDTGMGRLGIPYCQAFPEIEGIARLPSLVLEGIYTHFPIAERYPDAFGEKQLQDFEELIQKLRRKGISFRFRHAANSAGAIRLKSNLLNLVRPGLALYGVYPDPSLEKEIGLKPALTLKSRIVFLKRLRAGDSVSYGRQYAATSPTTIAVVPLGYSHGYPVSLSGKGEVLYGGRRFRIAGRVCMDSLMIELGDASARVGDEVILLGAQGGESVRAEEWAQLAKTIPYEIVTRLDAGIPRLYSRQTQATGPA